MSDWQTYTLIGIVILLLLLVFSSQISYLIMSSKVAVLSAISGESPQEIESGVEYMQTNPKKEDPAIGPHTADTLKALGYGGDKLAWDDVIAATELDPSTYKSHQEFIKDVRIFSSGANFTSVTDDNTNLDFVNFVGLQRPMHVDIGKTARQQPDIDTSVLKRNRQINWNYTG